MDLPVFGKWRGRHGEPREGSASGGGSGPGSAGGSGPGSRSGGAAADPDPDAPDIDELLGECELLRERAAEDGVELDGSAASLAALDQLAPDWRDEPEELGRLGNDAGLYLGTVVVLTVPGASWQVWPDGRPVVRLGSGREIDTVELGHGWAGSGTPELSQVLAEASED